MVTIAAKVAEGPALHPGLLSSDPALFILFASFYKKTTTNLLFWETFNTVQIIDSGKYFQWIFGYYGSNAKVSGV